MESSQGMEVGRNYLKTREGSGTPSKTLQVAVIQPGILISDVALGVAAKTNQAYNFRL
jgi:hypothetical protein